MTAPAPRRTARLLLAKSLSRTAERASVLARPGIIYAACGRHFFSSRPGETIHPSGHEGQHLASGRFCRAYKTMPAVRTPCHLDYAHFWRSARRFHSADTTRS
jgi:hypothetical protein